LSWPWHSAPRCLTRLTASTGQSHALCWCAIQVVVPSTARGRMGALLSHLSCACGDRKFGAPESVVLQLHGSGESVFRKLYDIQEELGRGNFGTVYACTKLGAPNPRQANICVKVAPLRGGHPTRIAKLCEVDRRALLMNVFELDHANLVRYHRFVSSDDTLYVVMERCRGPDLEDHRIDCGGFLPVESVRLLALQVLSALAAVHAMGIMHRDVKTENLRFADPTCQTVKLLDFGFAKPAQAEKQQHTVTGTLIYAAPEVFDGLYGNACDVWSAGVVLYLLLTGQVPFNTSDVSILRSMHRDPVLTGESLLRGDRWKAVPRGGRNLIRSLLVVDGDARLSAATMAETAWLLAPTGLESEDGACTPQTPLFRSGSTSCINKLKRTNFFVWNVAEERQVDEGTDGGLSPNSDGASPRDMNHFVVGHP